MRFIEFYSPRFKSKLYAPSTRSVVLLTTGHEQYLLDFLMDDLREDAIGIDKGACIGTFALPLAQQSPKGLVIACEPEITNYTCLLLNARELKLMNLFGMNVAIAGQRGILPFKLTTSAGHHVLATYEPDSRYSKVIGILPVFSLTLADLIQLWNLQRLDWLKIDTEGAEKEILLHPKTLLYLKKLKPKMAIEMHIEYDDKIGMRALKNIGYSVRQEFKDVRHSHNYLYCWMR